MVESLPLNRLIVIGASAGGVEALTRLVSRLPARLPAAIVVVVHFPAGGTSVLPRILERSGPLPVSHADDGDLLEPGRIFVARPGRHLLVQPGQLRLSSGPAENGCRPAIDLLFRSAADAYGARVVGVVLSGTRDDGTAGLMAIKGRDGLAVVQDPADALFAGMPQSAIDHVPIDYCLTIDEIPVLLTRLARQSAAEQAVPASNDDDDSETLEPAMHAKTDPSNPVPGGELTGLTCPNCGGALWEEREGDLSRYRCRIGHAFSPESLVAEQDESLEFALWAAVRALEERAALAYRLAQRAGERGQSRTTRYFEQRGRDAEQRAELIRQVLLRDDEEAVAGAAKPLAGGGQ